MSNGNPAAFDCAALKNAAGFACAVASKNSARPVLGLVHVDVDAVGGLVLSSTDSFRAARVMVAPSSAVDSQTVEPFTALVAAKDLAAAVKAVCGANAGRFVFVDVRDDGASLAFTGNGVTFHAAINRDATYPDLDGLFDRYSPASLSDEGYVLDPALLVGALSKMPKKVHAVRVRFADGKYNGDSSRLETRDRPMFVEGTDGGTGSVFVFAQMPVKTHCEPGALWPALPMVAVTS